MLLFVMEAIWDLALYNINIVNSVKGRGFFNTKYNYFKEEP